MFKKRLILLVALPIDAIIGLLLKSILLEDIFDKIQAGIVGERVRTDYEAVNMATHADINQIRSDQGGTVTGRVSMSNPNLQQIPSRGIIGLRSQMLTNTQGEAIMTHRFKEFQPHKGEIPSRQNGSMIGMYTGKAIPYSMFQLQERGKFFIQANVDVYEGQILGERGRPMDLVINVIKSKKLSNIRSSGADDKIKLIPPVQFTLEEALEYIQEDEYVEVTPKSIRLRKVLLKEHDRKRARNAALAIA